VRAIARSSLDCAAAVVLSFFEKMMRAEGSISDPSSSPKIREALLQPTSKVQREEENGLCLL